MIAQEGNRDEKELERCQTCNTYCTYLDIWPVVLAHAFVSSLASAQQLTQLILLKIRVNRVKIKISIHNAKDTQNENKMMIPCLILHVTASPFTDKGDSADWLTLSRKKSKTKFTCRRNNSNGYHNTKYSRIHTYE